MRKRFAAFPARHLTDHARVAARSDVVQANKAFATTADAAHTLSFFAFRTGESFLKAGLLEQADAAFAQATRCANPFAAGVRC